MRKIDLSKGGFYLVKDGERDMREGYLISLNPDDYFDAKAEIGIRRSYTATGHNKVVMAVRPFTVKDGEVTWGGLYSSEGIPWTVKLVSLGHITEPLHHANYEALAYDSYVRAAEAKRERELAESVRVARLTDLVDRANEALGGKYLEVGINRPIPRSSFTEIILAEAKDGRDETGAYQVYGKTVKMEELAEAIIALGGQE